ncbi:NUDIX domain-containing protein [Robiginitalea sp. M366]|uniref:NUDIX domain-containing protein n=1 Tax=Robiginitalea aestuariiviva TaxID=3036903 RepID=UPI00240D9116|nr:NUDIX domain-containing protein [Robiginitalea aestuariiviva]MDG1573401.1 NUDIX domain-containing protein [Robiginitalea aestuariiviva]
MSSHLPTHGSLRNVAREVLSDAWYTLYRYTFDYFRSDGRWDTQQREVYDRGNGAVVLLYDPGREKVLLTRQFRMPTYVNGNADGMLTEACAGLLDEADPEGCIQKEILEETGYRVPRVRRVLEAYSSPGAVTEKLYYFLAEYAPEMKAGAGGGLDSESEDIEVLEVSYAEVLQALAQGRIRDAKTVLLLQYAALYGPLREAFLNSAPAPR